MTRPRGRKFKAISRPMSKRPSKYFPNPTRLTASVVHIPGRGEEDRPYWPICGEPLNSPSVRWTSEPPNCTVCQQEQVLRSLGTLNG